VAFVVRVTILLAVSVALLLGWLILLIASRHRWEG
jgi:hypothetical protein